MGLHYFVCVVPGPDEFVCSTVGVSPMRYFWHRNHAIIITACGVAVMMIMLIGAVLALGGLDAPSMIKNSQVLQVESGEFFNCDFYYNGDMECSKVGDLEVGGGRIQP